MWKEVPRTRKKEVLSSHHVESSRPSLTTVSLEVPRLIVRIQMYKAFPGYRFRPVTNYINNCRVWAIFNPCKALDSLLSRELLLKN